MGMTSGGLRVRLHRAPRLWPILAIAALFVPLLMVAARSYGDDPPPKSALADGWERAVPILLSKPAPEGKVFRTVRGHVIAAVEKGWVVVRRETVDRDLEWQVVLAQATDPAEPKLRIDEATGALEVTYRRYFIRETVDGERLRVFRERKRAKMPEWPVVQFKSPESKWRIGGSSSGHPYIFPRTYDYWCWAEAGAIQERPDLYVRICPATRRSWDLDRSFGLRDGGGILHVVGGPIESRIGDFLVQEEEDLFLAIRANEASFENGIAGPAVTKWFESHLAKLERPPPLAARVWLNDKTLPLPPQNQ